MTENNAAQPMLTGEEIQDIADGFDIYGAKPEFARAIESALLSKLRAPVADERAAFEAWATAIAEKYDVTRNGDHYMEPYTEWVWEAWQARAALASAPVADERVAQEYGSPADVAQRIEQYLAQDGRMNSGTQLLYEAMKTLRGLAGESK